MSVIAELKTIKGIGNKLAKKIVEEVGGEREFKKVINNLEIDELVKVRGVSEKRAIEIIKKFRGEKVQKFLKTERAFQLYQDIIQKILKYTNTNYSKNKVKLLYPSNDPKKIKEDLNSIVEFKNKLEKLPRKKIENLLRKARRFKIKDTKPNFIFGRAVLVNDEKIYENLLNLKIDKYCEILLNPSTDELEDYDLLIYIQSGHEADIDYLPNLITLTPDFTKEEIVPEIILDYFIENKKLLDIILKIKRILGEKTVLEDVINIINKLKKSEPKEINIEEVVESVRVKTNKKIKERIKKIKLEGAEVLKLLNEGSTKKVDKIFEESIREAKKEIKEKTGINFDPFLKEYPLSIDKNELNRVVREIKGKNEIKKFEAKVNAAKKLKKLINDVKKEIKWFQEFDYKFALASFALNYGLNPPKLSKRFIIKNALHLDLIHTKNAQRVDYDVPGVTLLTGANSGGKTTLLETLAQIVILAHMGLPVNAEYAEVPIFDEIYFFSKQRSLDAGAFEHFVKTFTPALATKKRKLILLDELESITELDAGAKIIASFIEFIKESESFAVIVTHMAREIIKLVDVRVDGIEAKGLDENYNLIVDRTPKINYLAKSTPELILKKLYKQSKGKVKKMYHEMLKKFEK